MNDYEEDLDDFHTENSNTRAEFMIRAIRAQSTDEWKAASGVTTKIPPLFDVSTSWFKYEELIDHTVLEAGKRGPALKNRLIGVAEKYKGLLNRESVKADHGVKYFRDSVRPHFVI